jgi:hypothetical protein
MKELIRKVLLEETRNKKFLEDSVRNYVYDILTKHDYDDSVGDGYIIIWDREPYDLSEILIEFKDVNLDSPNMVDGKYVQYPDEYVGDLWISEKLIYRVENFIPLDREEIIKIIIECFEDEFGAEDFIINSVSFGDDSPSEYTNLNW